MVIPLGSQEHLPGQKYANGSIKNTSTGASRYYLVEDAAVSPPELFFLSEESSQRKRRREMK